MGIISKIKLPNSSVPYEIGANWLNITNKPDFRNIEVEVEGTVLNINEDATINASEASTPTTGVNDELKMALLQLAANVSYINENGESIYNTIQKALYDTITISSITAYYDDSEAVYNNDNIEKLRQHLIVKANYNNGKSGIIENYNLSGSLTTGDSTITVSCDNKTTSFTVNVQANPTLYVTYASSQHTAYDGDSLDSLRPFMTVFVNAKNKNYAAICDYALSGNLSTGTQTITVSYGGSSQTFQVSVLSAPRTLTSITALYTSTGHTVYDYDSLDSLKPYLTVTANYDNNSSDTVTDYALSGTLSAGTSTITVTYNNKTTTFNVTVEDNSSGPITIVSLSPLLNLNGAMMRTTNSVNDLKNYLTVTANYSDNTSTVLNTNDYTLSGSMELASEHYDASTNTITVEYEDKSATFTVMVYAEIVANKITLPSGYTQLTYIAGTNSNGPYIDTNVSPSSVNRVKYAVQPRGNAANGVNWVVLASDGMAYPYFRQGNSGAKTFQVRYNSGNATGLAETWEENSSYIIDTEFPTVNINGTNSVTSLTNGGVTSSRNFFFFARPTSSGGDMYGKVKLFYAEFYDSQDQLTHYYIPCKNNENITGLYDTVGQTFYSSVSDTNFDAGEVVQ